MKILFINSVCKSGSTGKITYDLFTELKNEGQQAAICYGRGKKVEEEGIIKFGIDSETYIHALLTRILGFTGCFSYFSTRKLLNFIKKYQPDVVHIHEMHAYFINLKPVLNFLKANNIKTVWTFHCEFMYTGRCGYTYDCANWKTGCGKCPKIKGYPKTMLFDFSSYMYKSKFDLFTDFNNLTIVAPSKWLAEKTKESFLQDKDIRVIHNGIETSKIFYPQDYEKLKKRHKLTNEKIVLAVAPGLMQERKGGKWILKLAKKMKDENVKFIMFGVEKPEEIKMSNVIALGRTENQIELAQYYSMADVFVICSLMENFPTVCLEALSCGTPVCGFDVGGISETAPGSLGKFVEYGNIPKLEEEVLEVLSQKKDSAACARYGKENYDKKVMYNSYKKIYGI